MTALAPSESRITLDTQADTKTLVDRSAALPALAPVTRAAVVLHPEYVSKEGRVLSLQEQNWHWKDVKYDVEDADSGDIVCSVDDHGHSLHDVKNIIGPNGDVLLCLKNKCATLKKTIIVEDAQGREVGQLKNTSLWKTALEFTCTGPSSSSSSSSDPTTLIIQGSIAKHEYEVVCEDEILAVIRKESGGKGYFKRDHSYTAQVAPGVDASLIACICVAADAVKHANQDGTMAAITA